MFIYISKTLLAKKDLIARVLFLYSKSFTLTYKPAKFFSLGRQRCHTPHTPPTPNLLDRWTPLPLSMLGRIALIKMIVLPQFLYLFQMIPIIQSCTIIKRINGWFSSFIWNRRKPRLKVTKMQLPRNKGGLAAADVRLYQLASGFGIFLNGWKMFQLG